MSDEEVKNNFANMRAEALRLADIVSDGYDGMFTKQGPDPVKLAAGKAVEPEMYRLLRHLAANDPDHYRPKPGDRVRHRRRKEPGYANITPLGLLKDEGLVIDEVNEREDGSGFYSVGFRSPTHGENAMVYFTSPYLEPVPEDVLRRLAGGT